MRAPEVFEGGLSSDVAQMAMSVPIYVHVVFTAVGISVDVPTISIHAVRDSVFILEGVAVEQ